jgi:GWxTD domain-containing protein
MKCLTVILCFLFVLNLKGQPLRDINYNYLYNPGQSFSFDLKSVRHANGWTVFYKLQLRDTSLRVDDYAVEWETRQTLSDKEGVPLTSAFGVQETSRNRTGFTGTIDVATASASNMLVAKVVHTSLRRAWVFYEVFEPSYPVNTYAKTGNEVLLEPYVNLTDKVTISGAATGTVSYYNDNFPAALPPFAEAQGRVSQGMKTDSTFQLSPEQEVGFSRTGLYLVQADTNATEGLAFRVEDDYPRLARVPSLAGPLMYICTKQEYDRLALAKNDKRAFDRIILGITNDTDRARKLMRSYFRRVELANQYFTSYKEGWKTDRGMIFIIFGLPEEVFKFSDREVWSYKNDLYKVTFSFARSSSIFDPENYVLIREKKYQETWYEVIDLWRSARF